MCKRHDFLVFLEKGVTKVPVRKEPQGTDVDLTDELPESQDELFNV